MKIADLYVRVSTDEQADKGYSQRDQEERLQKHCIANNISVRKIIYEDHSAKTFVRPEWVKYVKLLRKEKNKTDLVLFTKWDRFSRNAPDAYNMIATLRSLRVEPQAIEQPLDINVPENKMMLAIYLTAPEIENDRRGLNTFYGMRRARKEGRWIGLAPVGYVNRSTENGRKYIAPNGEQADLIKWSFSEIAKGMYSSEQIFKKAVERGLNCSKNNFLRSIRNPMYCGDILIPQFKDEEAYSVKGIHEPLISKTLFYQVQEILDGKKRTIRTKIIANDRLPLRGFLACSKCTRTLCGSASKGRNEYYYYYHCCSKCGCRYKANDVNKELVSFMEDFTIAPAVAELFKMVILDVYANDTIQFKENKASLARQLTEHSNKLAKARELVLTGDIDGPDYREMKLECERNIALVDAQLAELGKNSYSQRRLAPIIDNAISTLTMLNVIYCKSGTEEKRRLIGSMFAEKFTFENLKHRTAKLSDAFECIYQISNKIGAKKTGQNPSKKSLPRNGWLMGLEPTTLGTTNQYSNQLSYNHRFLCMQK